MLAAADCGPSGAEADSDVAGGARGGTERDEGRNAEGSRPQKGTPQGGVISPLLANLYLHWFDTVFHRPEGPAHWAKAKLVRYADDFVVLARQHGPAADATGSRRKLEGWLGLEINREKTRVVDLAARKERVWTFWDLRFGTTAIRWTRDTT